MRPHYPLGAYPAYLFDVDGTLLYPDHAVPGAPEVLAALKARGRHVIAVTNNSSRRPGTRWPTAFGASGCRSRITRCSRRWSATAQLVAHEQPGARVHVFGNPGLRTKSSVPACAWSTTATRTTCWWATTSARRYAWMTTAMRLLLPGGALRGGQRRTARTSAADGGLMPGRRRLAWPASSAPSGAGRTWWSASRRSRSCSRQRNALAGRRTSACTSATTRRPTSAGRTRRAWTPCWCSRASPARAEECAEPPEYVLPSVAELLPLLG